jgi:hypothetical protein
MSGRTRTEGRSYHQSQSFDDPDNLEGDPEPQGGLNAQERVRQANRLGASRRGVFFVPTVSRSVLLVGAGTVGLAILAFVIYLLAASRTAQVLSSLPTTGSETGRSLGAKPSAAPQPGVPASGSTAPAGAEAAGRSGATPQSAYEEPAELESQGWPSRIAAITLKLALAALIAAILAFRPRKDLPLSRRDPNVLQAQILLAVATAAVVLIVAGDIARGLIALAVAVLLIPFRAALPDSKEAIVMVICGASGLATGAGRLEIALILGAFAFLMLWALDHYGTPEPLDRTSRERPAQ